MRIIGIIVLCALLAGCGASTYKVSPRDFDPNKTTYLRDNRTNICFAVIGYSHMDSGGHADSGISHSVVPCTPEVLELLGK
jgi:hypothetical protein